MILASSGLNEEKRAVSIDQCFSVLLITWSAIHEQYEAFAFVESYMARPIAIPYSATGNVQHHVYAILSWRTFCGSSSPGLTYMAYMSGMPDVLERRNTYVENYSGPSRAGHQAASQIYTRGPIRSETQSMRDRSSQPHRITCEGPQGF